MLWIVLGSRCYKVGDGRWGGGGGGCCGMSTSISTSTIDDGDGDGDVYPGVEYTY